MSKWALTKIAKKMLSLAVQVHIGAPEGPILVQCIPCTARGDGAVGPVGYKCLELRKNVFLPRYWYFRFGLQLNR